MTTSTMDRFRISLETLLGRRIDCTEGGPYGLFNGKYWILFHAIPSSGITLEAHKRRYPDRTREYNSQIVETVSAADAGVAIGIMTLTWLPKYMPEISERMTARIINGQVAPLQRSTIMESSGDLPVPMDWNADMSPAGIPSDMSAMP